MGLFRPTAGAIEKEIDRERRCLSKPSKAQAPPRPAKQATLNDTVDKLEAMIALQQKQIETLTSQLKEQSLRYKK